MQEMRCMAEGIIENKIHTIFDSHHKEKHRFGTEFLLGNTGTT
jgi:hypothetical protein